MNPKQQEFLNDFVNGLVIEFNELGYRAHVNHQRHIKEYPIWVDINMSACTVLLSVYRSWIDCYVGGSSAYKRIELDDPDMMINLLGAINELSSTND